MSTGIEWTDETWNPTRGCSRVSPGCVNCYAERTAMRQIHDGYKGLVHIANGHPAWTGVVRVMKGKTLEAPLHWRKPRRVFVNSMSDLFHEAIPFEAIDEIFTVMVAASQHTYQILTKRADRMLEYFRSGRHDGGNGPDRATYHLDGKIWLGVSVENQKYADERIPLLLQAPAAVRFVSYEPALGPVDFNRYVATFAMNAKGDYHTGLDWIIVGGESGPGARPFDVAWARNIVKQCKAANVACFVKQLGAYPVESWAGTNGVNVMPKTLLDRKGGDPSEWPEDLRMREFPSAGVPA